MGRKNKLGIVSRNRRRYERGFSLIELIIAIAILVILTGLLAPQFLKYIERSRRAVCMSAMDTISGEYMVGLIERDQSVDAKSAVLVLDKVMEGHHAKKSSSSEGSLVYLYEGICKSGGEYRCEFSEDVSYLTMECSKHGGWELDIITLKRALEKLDFSSPTYGTLPYKNLDAYFNETDRIQINSEAVSTGGYGEIDSFAKAIERQLGEQGINIKNKSWRLYKKGENYKLTLAEKKITADDVGKVINCSVYNFNTKKVEHGTAKIVLKDNKYPVIDGGTFTSTEK